MRRSSKNNHMAELVHAHNLPAALILDIVRADTRISSCVHVSVWYNSPGFPQASETRTSQNSVSARRNVQPPTRRVSCCQIQGAEDGEQGWILDGDLETLGLQATLKMLSLGGKTGALLVSSGQEHLKITLRMARSLPSMEPHIPPPDVIEIFSSSIRSMLNSRACSTSSPATTPRPRLCSWPRAGSSPLKTCSGGCNLPSRSRSAARFAGSMGASSFTAIPAQFRRALVSTVRSTSTMCSWRRCVSPTSARGTTAGWRSHVTRFRAGSKTHIPHRWS